VIAVAMALAILPAHAIYKWVDEKGVTHFSETPPPDGRKAEKLQPKVVPPSGPVAPPPDWRQREQESKARAIERNQADDAARARSQKQAAERADTCQRARRRLALLSEKVPVYSRNERGERTYIEDADREVEIGRMRQAIEANCDSR
jgi:hypothetical protein